MSGDLSGDKLLSEDSGVVIRAGLATPEEKERENEQEANSL